MYFNTKNVNYCFLFNSRRLIMFFFYYYLIFINLTLTLFCRFIYKIIEMVFIYLFFSEYLQSKFFIEY